MQHREPCVYILASGERRTLYVGVTSNLSKRVWEHRNRVVSSFTSRHRIHTLVWFEQHDSMASAIAREKAVKGWRRIWKIELIERFNPGWRDLYLEIL